MSGLDLAVIHVALADQIRASVERDVNVAAWPNSSMTLPVVEVWPGVPYVDYFTTFGPTGTADIQLRVRVEVDSIDPETGFRMLTDFLSVGTGNPSSIADALHADRTLGGAVADVVSLSCEWSPSDDGWVAWLPVGVIVNKQGAEV